MVKLNKKNYYNDVQLCIIQETQNHLSHFEQYALADFLFDLHSEHRSGVVSWNVAICFVLQSGQDILSLYFPKSGNAWTLKFDIDPNPNPDPTLQELKLCINLISKITIN